MLGERAAHDVFVYVEAKGVGNLLGDLYTAKLGIVPFQLTSSPTRPQDSVDVVRTLARTNVS